MERMTEVGDASDSYKSKLILMKLETVKVRNSDIWNTVWNDIKGYKVNLES